MTYSLVTHSAVTVPCHRGQGRACRGCSHCGKGTRLEITDSPSTQSPSTGLRLYTEPMDERAFPVEVRGW